MVCFNATHARATSHGCHSCDTHIIPGVLVRAQLHARMVTLPPDDRRCPVVHQILSRMSDSKMGAGRVPRHVGLDVFFFVKIIFVIGSCTQNARRVHSGGEGRKDGEAWGDGIGLLTS